jgi:predicted AlkP superfamily phosphohydrolase/phosphomutase
MTHPEGLKEELISDLDVTFKYAILDKLSQSAAYLGHLVASVEAKKRIDLHLLDKYPLDCFITVYSHLDTIQHYFWRYLDLDRPSSDRRKARKFEPHFRDFFAGLDRAIAETRRFVAKDGCTVIVSDHGFGPVSRVVNLNRFLHKLGYVSLNKDRRGKGSLPFKVDYRKILDFLSRMDVLNIKGKLSREARERIKQTMEGGLTPEIDFPHSLAFFGQPMDQGIFINPGHGAIGHSPEKYSEARESIKSLLRQLKDPLGERHVIESVFDREELYRGEYVGLAPDIVFQTAPGYFCQSGITAKGIIEDQKREFVSGNHRPEGIFIAQGRNILRGRKLAALGIMDVLPTVLAMLGLKIPEDIEGRAAQQIFE